MSAQLSLLAFPPTLLTSPKQQALSASDRSHVRVEVVTYKPMTRPDGTEYLFHHGIRVDVSISEFKRICKAAPDGHAKSALLDALSQASRER